MIKLIKILKRIKDIRNPCNKCLVNSMCGVGKRCDKFKKHCHFYELLGESFTPIILGLEVTIIVIIIAFAQLLMRS